MTDPTAHLLTTFRDEVPFPDETTAAQIYDRVTRPAATRRRSARRSRLALALVAAALVLSAAGVAAVSGVPWWQGGEPALDPQAVASVARDNMPATVDVANARTVARAGSAALVAVPLDQSGYCLIPALDGRATIGAQCNYQADDRTLSVVRPQSPDHAAAWIVYGRITDARATRIDLGAFAVDLARGGFFVAQVPQSKWSQLSDTANPGTISGSGSVLRRGCVNWGPSPESAAAREGNTSVALWTNSARDACKPQEMDPPPVVDMTRAQKLFDVTLENGYSIWKAGDTLTFSAAPMSDGTTCVLATGPASRPVPDFGGRCVGTVIRKPGPGRSPLSVELGASLEHDADGAAFYVWTVTGAIDPGLHATKVALEGPDGSKDFSVGGGFLFGQLPVTTPGPAVGTVPLPPGAWVLDAYNAAGDKVASVDLVKFQHEASPH